MLSTKENLKQIEMDTIQQEPLLTKLTPEAAATVEGGARYRASAPLRVYAFPRFSSPVLYSIRRNGIIEARPSTTGLFRKILRKSGWVVASLTKRIS